MAISFVGSASVQGASSITIPAHQAGDLIIIAAGDDNASVSVASGYTSIGASSTSFKMGYKFATSSGETSGTWTGATALSVAVYRGVAAVGGSSSKIGIGAARTWNAFTMLGDAASWIVLLSAWDTANPDPSVTGYTEREENRSEGSGEVAWTFIADRTGITSFGGDASADTGTTIYSATAIELLAEYYPQVAGTETDGTGTNGSSVSLTMPSGIVAGELLIALAAYDSPGTTDIDISGWTQVYQSAFTSNVIKIAMFAKIATGSDTATMTGAAQDYAYTVFRVKDHGVTDIATDIVVGTVNEQTTTTPDSLSLDTGTDQPWLFVHLTGVDSGSSQTTDLNSSDWNLLSDLRSATTVSAIAMITSYRNGNFQTLSAVTNIVATSVSQEALTRIAAIPPYVPPPAADGLIFFRDI